jgi:SecD/SecF fusion protein
LALVRGALLSERSLQKVTQFGKQVASQAQNQAGLALVFAMVAITIYIWVRFGTLRYGLGAVVALAHDVSVMVGAVAVGYFVSLTPIGKLLGIQDFKIDLTMIAAILTLVGYSVNDTIVVFDRIRENRGKLSSVSAALVNASINQTLSRTLLTSLTVIFVLAVLYAAGGQGIHGMSYALLVGVIVGTYSSIAIASPLLLMRARARTAAG